ncbi:MAG: hypothetical protein MJ087_03125 [Lachnospiraceae bacterium]|nr:hypothetical protein [Lachnospiraceae bacterium]
MYPCKCACCSMAVIKEQHERCPLCGWVDDPAQRADRNLKNGKNEKSLEEYFEEFSKSFGMSYCCE